MVNWVALLVPALSVFTLMMKDEVSPVGAAVVHRHVASLVIPAKALPAVSVILLVASRVDVVT